MRDNSYAVNHILPELKEEQFDRFEEKMAKEILDESHLPVAQQSLVFRLRKRAEIRRQIPGRLAVTEGKPDKIANLLDEAADEIIRLKTLLNENYARSD
jgi:hypothetical protein